MPESTDTVASQLIDAVANANDADETATAVKTLKTFAEAKKLLDPEPLPEPEPTGLKAFFGKHSGDLIKAGTTLVVVGAIAIIEARGDVIFRSKASKFI